MKIRTIQKQVEIIEIHYRKSQSVALFSRDSLAIYGIDNRPVKSTIERLVEKFEYTGTVKNVLVLVLLKMMPLEHQLRKSQIRLSNVKLKCWASQTHRKYYTLCLYFNRRSPRSLEMLFSSMKKNICKFLLH